MNKILCLVVAVCCTLSGIQGYVLGEVSAQIENVGIDATTMMAVQAFALKAADKLQGIDGTWEVLAKMDELAGNLSIDDLKDLLMRGSFEEQQALMIVETLLPIYSKYNFDEHTQITSLLALADLVCDEEHANSCDVKAALAAVSEPPLYSCLTEDEQICKCANQSEIFLVTRFTDGKKFATDEFLNTYKCLGSVDDDIKEINCFCFTGIEERAGDPKTRASSDMLKQIMLQQMAADNADPMMLSIIANSGNGLSSSEAMKQVMMAQMGLDPTLTHVLLNGGKFHEDEDINRQVMLQYIASSGAIPQMMLPLLANADNAKEFMIFSMLSAGDIDSMTGLIMLSQMSDDIDSALVQQIILETLMTGADTDKVLASITDPYVPELPDGIFPGSELYFAHFNALEVSTCALHDLRNRFDCGYIGISAADCEKAPYCCYSPVFMSDEQVSSSTDGDIEAASSIPWCYYNVFFVFPTEFALTVQSVGGFAAGVQCPPLFKYGLELDSTTYALAQGSDGLGSLINDREDCGFPGITEFHCVAIRGCCFDPDAPILTPQCYKPRAGVPSILEQTVPDVFKGVIGHCDMNIYQVPLLYLLRKPCHYSLGEYQAGFDILQEPTAEDCLTRLGCCYEFDDKIAAANKKSPRCYQKNDAGLANPITVTAAELEARVGIL